MRQVRLRGWIASSICGAFAVLIAMLASAPSFAEETSSRYRRLSVFDPAYLKGYASDTASVFTSPLRWDGGDWGKAAAVLAVAAGAYALDDNIQRSAQRNRSEGLDDLAGMVRPFGDAPIMAGASLGIYGIGAAFGGDRLQDTGLMALESVFVSRVFTEFMKRGFHRHRPETGADKGEFDGPDFFSSKNASMSSGHASTAFAVATVIATQYKDTLIVPIVAYALAGLTAWSRVNDNKHWASDIAIGAAIGHFTARHVMKRIENRRSTQVGIAPLPLSGGTGLSVAFRF